MTKGNDRMSQVSMTNLGVWSSTKAKLDRIAEMRRWSLVNTIDFLADDFLSKVEGQQPAPTSDPARGETAKAGSIPPASPVSQSSVTVSKRKPVRSGKRITDAA